MTSLSSDPIFEEILSWGKGFALAEASEELTPRHFEVVGKK